MKFGQLVDYNKRIEILENRNSAYLRVNNMKSQFVFIIVC